jgi:hypothetical protein
LSDEAYGEPQDPPSQTEDGAPKVLRPSGRATRQPRFYDFNVYSGYKVREKLEYMHANPVKRGLLKNPSAWIWSSYLFYEKGQTGLVTIDPVS